jgi:hypothetical protein
MKVCLKFFFLGTLVISQAIFFQSCDKDSSSDIPDVITGSEGILISNPIFLDNSGSQFEQGEDIFCFELEDWDRDTILDIIGIKMKNTGTKTTELHVLPRPQIKVDSIGDKEGFLLQSGTGLGLTDVNWSFELVDWDEDGKLDLVGIKKNNISGTIELHILLGAGGYTGLPIQIETGLGLTDANWSFKLVDWNGDGELDLVGIKKNNTGTSTTELHVLSGPEIKVDSTDENKGFLFQSGTGLGLTDANWSFELVDWDEDGKLDLVGIKKNNISGTIELHILSGRSSYKDFIYQVGIRLDPKEDNWSFKIADWNEDGQLDLIGIKKNNTDTGTTEFHVMDIDL